MVGSRRLRMGLLAGAALVIAIPASASGAVTIGSNLTGSPTLSAGCFFDGCTLANASLPATSQAPGGLIAKIDGVVVRWRIALGPGSVVSPVALRITRPGDSDTRTGAGTSPTVTPAEDQISTFDVRLPIQSGDALGIDCCPNQSLYMYAETTGAQGLRWVPQLVDGEAPRDGGGGGSAELLVNADIEPDADRDGFGDETQDLCPTDATKQAVECDPPETTITKDAPKKTTKNKVKFKFVSDEAGSTFECKLDKKPYKPCTSPKKVKVGEGKHKFAVRATDAAGNVDLTPDKDKFKVV